MNEPNTFKAQLVVDFEFTEGQASHILSDPSPAKALRDWVNSHPASEPDASTYCATELYKALGIFLATKRVKECRQLPLSSPGEDPTPHKLPESVAKSCCD